VRGINKHRNKGRSVCKEFPSLLGKWLQLQKRFTDFSTLKYRRILSRLSPRRRSVLEKLRLPQLAKTFPAFYGTLKFITVFTTAHHFSVFWATRTRSTVSNPISLRTILILYVHVTVHRNRFLFKQPTRRTNYLNIYSVIKLYTLLFAHHQEFSTAHLEFVSFMQVFFMTASKQSHDETAFHLDSAWKRSSKTCVKHTNAECTV